MLEHTCVPTFPMRIPSGLLPHFKLFNTPTPALQIIFQSLLPWVTFENRIALLKVPSIIINIITFKQNNGGGEGRVASKLDGCNF